MAGGVTGAAEACPCGSGSGFSGCCAPFLEGAAIAPTAEALMRSRYSAYTLGRDDYLLQTWHPAHRPESLNLDPEQSWLGLKVLRTEHGGEAERQVHSPSWPERSFGWAATHVCGGAVSGGFRV